VFEYEERVAQKNQDAQDKKTARENKGHQEETGFRQKDTQGQKTRACQHRWGGAFEFLDTRFAPFLY